jgi:cell division protein FtsI/penicillin-binding protein 2/cell division protein FtsW (lipid II flippase)
MARTLNPPAPASPALLSGRSLAEGWRARALERSSLLWNVPLVFLGAWGCALAQPQPSAAFPTALMGLGSVWLLCVALHLLFCLTRFGGDLLILPLLSLVLEVGAAFHLDIGGPSTPGLTPRAYAVSVLVGILVLALVTTGGRWFRRLSLLLEEKVWWRAVGARPYYESVPFHLLLLGMMGLLLLLLKVGGIRSDNGAFVQVTLPGGIRFTPSELVRLAVAFFLADYLGRNSRVLRNLRRPLGKSWPLNRILVEPRTDLLILLVTVALYCAFFYWFHDFGPAVVIIVLTLTALYAATGRPFTPIAIGLGLAFVIWLTVRMNVGFHTLRNRVEMWLHPWDTHFVNGDHQARILWSIASGGWFGMGVGTQDLPHLLPLARNDAAFAGVIASMGMWVGLAVLLLFAGLTWRGMLAARQAPTDRTRLLAFCLTGLMALQALWICGAMVRVFPFTGINLPFISTGLTNMIASAIALGTIWNLSRPQSGPPGARSAWGDATEATPEVLRGVTRLALPITASFALPAVGVVLFACPWLLGDRTLLQGARGIGRKKEATVFANPYLERFRKRFPRGRIFSADGKLLAVSNPNPTEIDAVRKGSPSFAAYVERKERLGGAGTRYYPMAALTAQLVGWTRQGEFMAREGSVETACDSLLRGYNPSQLPFYFRTRHNPLVRPPEAQDLQLTVDTSLQQFAAERLQRAVKSWDGAGGALVVYDASTGAVLAAVTAPSFDPNGLTLERMRGYVRQDPRTRILTNKALARDALYFPGSTFKILTAAAAVRQGTSGAVTCRNGRNAEAVTWNYGGKRWRRDAGKVSDYGRGGHGTLNLSGDLDRALAVSCNVFFGKLAAELGVERLRQAMLDAELARVPRAEELAEYLPYAGFGQTVVKTSPLEMAMLAAAAGVARDDAPETPAARPYWLEAMVTRSGKREPEGVFGAPDRKPYRPFPGAVAQRLRRMMIGVVADPSGTAHAAFFQGGQPRLQGITVGGKTGTAEFEKASAGPRRPRRTVGRHAWFVGFARNDLAIQPRTLAFAVLVEDVRRGATGGQVCAPVARDVVQRLLPVAGEEPRQTPDELDRFYQRQVRPRLGPLGPLVDWLRQRVTRH